MTNSSPKEHEQLEFIDEVSLEDYDIALVEGVDDETLNEKSGDISFSISSFGADYTVDMLVKRMTTKAFFIPEFQRSFVWSLRHASRFIESLLMGLPVPGIFLYREKKTNRHLVIDGQQRLKTLQYFYKGSFGEKKFRLTGVQENWEGKTYEELETSDRLRMDDSIIHATIFTQERPRSRDQSIYYVFERINSGGIRLSPHEIRTCVNYGAFIGLLKDLNEYQSWRTIFGSPNKRLKDQELILRFLALYYDGDKYFRPMNEFLNRFSEENADISDKEAEEFSGLFIETIDVCLSAFGEKSFRVTRALNAAVFDAVMVGIAKRLEQGPIRDLKELNSAYKRLLSNKSFIAAYIRSTADEECVRMRLDLAITTFEAVK